ncbi:MAG: hypothetical protein ABIP80_06100 [Ferruginibacter sp.]
MKILLIPVMLLLLVIFSCQKSTDNPPASSTSYMSMSAGSTRNYEITNNNPPAPPAPYIITSTSRDTIVGTRTFHIFSNSTSGSEYYNVSGNDYYSYQRLPAALGTTSVQNLYLKDNAPVNTSWAQSFNVSVSGIPLTVNITNKIIEKGVSRTVNNIIYNDVIHVKTDISANSLFGPITGLTTDIHTYYAPRVGEIENTSVIDLDFMGFINHTNTRSVLKSATIL